MQSGSRNSIRFLLPQRNQTQEQIANNNDLLTEILARLPLKSLLRFKSVSTHWLSLISSPSFSRRLFPDPYIVSGLLLPFGNYYTGYEYQFIPLTHDHNPSDQSRLPPFTSLLLNRNPPGVRILQSCNGLILCSSCGRHRGEWQPEEDYYICNPTTKLFLQLPHPSCRITFGMNLAFDPAKSPHYKVICIRNPDVTQDEDAYQIEVYSSETRSWRLSGSPFVAYVNTVWRSPVFCQGALFWISTWGPCVKFEVEEEMVGEIPMPPVPEGWEERRYVYFGQSGGRLHLVEVYTPPTTQFQVYEMGQRDYCSGWTVKYRVDLGPVVASYPAMKSGYVDDPGSLHYYLYDILGVFGGEEEECYMVLHVPGKILRFTLGGEMMTVREICDFESSRGIEMGGCVRSYRWFDVFHFVQSFSSV